MAIDTRLRAGLAGEGPLPPGRFQRRARQRQPTAGFTLIEMIAVLAVLGLVLGIVVARGPMRSTTLETRAAARQLAQALRGARALAIARDRPVAVVLDPARHEYRTDGGAPQFLPAGITLSVTALATQSLAGLAAIRFAPDGSATGGQIALAQGSATQTVGVEWLTGRVSVTNAP